MPKRTVAEPAESSSPANDSGENPTPFLERVAGILLCLSKGTDSITEISRQSGYSLSTTHRILHALKKQGFSLYDDVTRRYYLGPLVTQLASSFQINHRSLFMCALPEMQHLSDVTGEVIAIRVLVGMQSFYLYEIPATQNISVNLNPPAIEPVIPVGPINMVFLAKLSSKDLREAIRSYVISSNGTHPSDVESIITYIKQVRRQGYDLATGHRLPGITALAAPVENYGLPAALCLVGLESRLSPKINDVIELVKQSANQISRHLKEISKEEDDL